MKYILMCLVAFNASMMKVQAQTRADYAEYINRYAALALAEEARTGIPACIKMAQALLESGAGKGSLAQRSNNHFGIKCKTGWTGPTFLHDDDASQECFRGYLSVEESFADHSNYLRSSPRYQKLFELNSNDYNGWAHGLKAAGYATNPKYPQLLLKVIRENHLDSLQYYAGKGFNASYASNAPEAVSKIAFVKSNENVKSIPVVHTSSVTIHPQTADVTRYPEGVFAINGLRVTYVKAGTSILGLAQTYGLSAAQLNSFNDMNEYTVIKADQLVFLERKKRQAEQDHYEARAGENLWAMSQRLGVRLQVLQAANPSFRGFAKGGESISVLEPGRKVLFPSGQGN